ncbi:hypothetical protein OSB04_008850 [Centaurea solstitialis]|uniref:Transposase n=1 Tax=Centaurea solstitialis TaxID=347529 RepID=A0AA38WRN5_9ASTR|nr:hypothetical protein OSB04_008850 [Centaurea solstitialis]
MLKAPISTAGNTYQTQHPHFPLPENHPLNTKNPPQLSPKTPKHTTATILHRRHLSSDLQDTDTSKRSVNPQDVDLNDLEVLQSLIDYRTKRGVFSFEKTGHHESLPPSMDDPPHRIEKVKTKLSMAGEPIEEEEVKEFDMWMWIWGNENNNDNEVEVEEGGGGVSCGFFRVNEAVKLIVGDEATSSRQTRRTPKSRNRIVAREKLVNDYFSDNPVYDDNDFERRFRMTRRLFLKIVEDLEREYEFFRWTHDARGVKGFSPLQKCTSAIRQLAYGTAADATDEYLQMSETTSRECFTNFCEAWRGQYHRGDHQGPTTVLEAVASYDSWIWHAYYGTPGAVNDIVVVNQSPIFNDLFEGKAPDSSFSVNGRQYKHGYYLADGIYPKWTTFVKAYRYPTEPERIAFTERQESARKDIERAFAMLKSK